MSTNLAGTGLPLLSGPLQDISSLSDRAESSCRRCNKEFNILFSRARRCNHCGYAYCSSCSDYQALMPRAEAEGTTGYEPVNVCAFCNDMLYFTASSKARLKSYSVAQLRKYMEAYDIKAGNGILEKDDLIDIIIRARAHNGCLPRSKENYYRKNSVPNRTTERLSAGARARNFLSRATGSLNANSNATQQPSPNTSPNLPRAASTPPRPQPATRPPPSHHHTPPLQRPQPPPPQTRPSPQQSPHTGSTPLYNHPPRTVPPSGTPPDRPSPMPRPTTTPPVNRPPPTPPRFTANPPPPPPRPSMPAPSLTDLLHYSSEEISKLSVHNLKSILFLNHVNARLAVEKSELVERVAFLVEQERLERDAARLREEQEEREAQERAQRADEERIKLQHQMMEEQRQREAAHAEAMASDGDSYHSDGDSLSSRPKSTSTSPVPPPQSTERTGLCVVCQDEDANIVVLDCGHLCLCSSCSNMVMSSTRECPMCRTRIVTEARLLRVFKT